MKQIVIFHQYFALSGKLYKLELYLQFLTNRKSYMVYRTAPFSTTLNNANPVFTVTQFFDAECLTNGKRYCHSCYKMRMGSRTKLLTITISSELVNYSMTRSWASCLSISLVHQDFIFCQKSSRATTLNHLMKTRHICSSYVVTKLHFTNSPFTMLLAKNT